MSSLSNLPYGKILDYWYEKLSGKSFRNKFLLTKVIEVFTFKTHSGNRNNVLNYFEFPTPKINTIPETPRLSIIIPTFLKTENDKQNIFNLLQSIDSQTLKPYEVIVIDDCSPLNYIFPETISVYRLKQNSGPAKARNLGKEYAIKNGSDIIAFTDSDCIVSENWVSIITQSFLDFKDFQILSGDTSSYDQSWFGTYHNINGTLNGRRLKNTEKLLYGTTANLAITREVATKIDFNENFPNAAGEDIEFCFKANEQGFMIKYIQNMIVLHNYGFKGKLTEDIQRFIKQFRKYGKGEIILLKEIPSYYSYFDRTEEISTQKFGNNASDL